MSGLGPVSTPKTCSFVSLWSKFGSGLKITIIKSGLNGYESTLVDEE